MANVRVGFRRVLAVFLTIGGALGQVFSIILLVTAISGTNTPSSVLMVGFGFISLVLSVLVFVFALRQWTRTKSGSQG
jgi:hypothetical protein